MNILRLVRGMNMASGNLQEESQYVGCFRALPIIFLSGVLTRGGVDGICGLTI
jgi:hypothetical protein